MFYNPSNILKKYIYYCILGNTGGWWTFLNYKVSLIRDVAPSLSHALALSGLRLPVFLQALSERHDLEPLSV
jgi:hypothetical protein